MKSELWPIDSLQAYANNPRTHSPEQIQQIAASIDEFGFVGSIIVRGKTIAKGHGTLSAVQMLYAQGKTVRPPPDEDGKAAEPFPPNTIPVTRVDGWSEAQFRAFVIADNQLALNAGWDMGLLKAEIIDLQYAGFDIGLLGFPDLTEILAFDPESAGGDRDPDAAPPLAAVPISKTGDIWKLGAHSVMCGDSRSSADWSWLMNGALADLCWTDPPYNVDYGSRPEMLAAAGKAHKVPAKIQNDNLSATEFRRFLAEFYGQIYKVLKPGGAIYVAHSETERAAFTEGFTRAGFKLSGCLIWRKNALVLGRSPYQWIHEPILFGWKPGRSHRWFGSRKQTTVQDWGEPPLVQPLADGRFQITLGESILIVDATTTIEQVEPSVITFDKPRANDVHPTMKPVGLVARMLRNSGRRGDLVVDGCGGSGSTLIAADTLGMEARLMEIDPLYVDVIVRRWQEWSGRRATHAATGLEFPATEGVTP